MVVWIETKKIPALPTIGAECDPIGGLAHPCGGNYNTTHNHNHWDVLPIYYYDPDQTPTAAAWSGDHAPGKSDVGETMWKGNYFNPPSLQRVRQRYSLTKT